MGDIIGWIVLGFFFTAIYLVFGMLMAVATECKNRWLIALIIVLWPVVTACLILGMCGCLVVDISGELKKNAQR